MSVEEFYRIEGLPTLQNRVFCTQAEAMNSTVGNVVLVQDTKTGLVFNKAFDPVLLSYDENYQNEQACSKVFQWHLEEVLKVIDRHMKGYRILEIGCGKGHFLSLLKTRGYSCIGVDPAFEGDSSDVVKEFFTLDLGLKGEGLILRHVLEHVQEPVNFLSSIQDANGGDGLIYIEVPCFDWIMTNRAWFDVFYEHVNYFRLSDFHRIFGKIIESGHLFGGQYIYVVADLATLRDPTRLVYQKIDFPPDFTKRISGAIAQISGCLAQGKKFAIWGGSSKGVVFSVLMKKIGYNFDYVIDINPVKRNKFLPVTGAKIINVSDATEVFNNGDLIFIMNGNYADEILEMSQNRYNYYLMEGKNV